MNFLTEFEIPFKGMSEGIHSFSFEIEESFFKHFGDIPEDGRIKVDVQLDNKRNFLTFKFSFVGYILVPCDRCLDNVQVDLDFHQRLIVKFGGLEEEDLDIVTINEDDHIFDLSRHIYEFIKMETPFRNVHKSKKECNKEAIKKLEEIELKENRESVDSRWNKLKDLLDNN